MRYDDYDDYNRSYRSSAAPAGALLPVPVGGSMTGIPTGTETIEITGTIERITTGAITIETDILTVTAPGAAGIGTMTLTALTGSAPPQLGGSRCRPKKADFQRRLKPKQPAIFRRP